MWSLLLKHKEKIGVVVSVIAVVITGMGYHASAVKAHKEQTVLEVTTQIQTEHNKLIEEQRKAHEQDLQAKLNKHAQELINAERARDNYWKQHYASKQADLINEYETKLAAEKIRNESNHIDDNLNPDTVRLLNQARNLVSTPTDYDYRVAGHTNITTDRQQVVSSLLSRLDANTSSDR